MTKKFTTSNGKLSLVPPVWEDVDTIEVLNTESGDKHIGGISPKFDKLPCTNGLTDTPRDMCATGSMTYRQVCDLFWREYHEKVCLPPHLGAVTPLEIVEFATKLNVTFSSSPRLVEKKNDTCLPSGPWVLPNEEHITFLE